MTRKEQRHFINELFKNLKAEILQFKYPETWNGIELRWLVEQKVSGIVWGDFRDKRKKRFKDFENECIINNWI